jgi:2-polyprenyl-6-methoxyphenol hydroxylase-like FAD-dependent oxidoreductase
MSAIDARILGTGIVSRCMALALARQGLHVALQARPVGEAGFADVRAFALNPASVALLKALKVWDALPHDARTPVHDMKVHGDAHGAAIEFSAWAQAVPELAWIVDAAALEAVLDTATRFSPALSLVPQPGAAPLTLIAEGKASVSREALGVRWQRHAYGHVAVAARLISDRPHGSVARQWFRSPDIIALLPFDRPVVQHSWALVWSMPEAQARDMAAANVADFEAALQQATGGVAGDLRLSSGRAQWSLAVGHAWPVCGAGWALLGDAAHVVHPLAGQGLNLGLADVMALAEVIAQREAGRGLGDPALLGRYARQRWLANQRMATMTDGLWQLFANPTPMARELRNRGLALVNQVSPLKRWLMNRALKV